MKKGARFEVKGTFLVVVNVNVSDFLRLDLPDI
jgi:hypothetical protein